MSRRVKKIPRVKRTTRGSSSSSNNNNNYNSYNDNSSYGGGNNDARYMASDSNTNQLRSFDSQPISRKKTVPLRRSDDRSSRGNNRYGSSGDNMYDNNNSYASRDRRQQQQSNKPVQRSRPSPKKVVSEDESDDDNYDDEDFDDYNDDDFDDMSDDDEEKPLNKKATGSENNNYNSSTTTESKISYKKKEKTDGGARLRFPTAKLNDDRNNNNNKTGSSKMADNYNSKNNEEQFGVVSSPHAKSKNNINKRELDVNPARERRLRELKKLVNLTEESNVTLNLAPLQPYDVYVRKLGSKTWKQAANLTNDDARTTETQTPDITYNDQSGQVPDDLGFGNSNSSNNNNNNGNSNNSSKNNNNSSNALLSFLRRISPVIEISLEENIEDQNLESKSSDNDKEENENKSAFLTPKNKKLLKYPIWLSNRKITAMSTANNSASTVLTSYGPKEMSEKISKDDVEALAFTASLAGKGLTCVWHADDNQTRDDGVTLPYKALICEGIPTCCAFSPSRAHIVVAGTLSGSIVLWDLREPSSYHANEESVYFKYPDCFRRPTYTTDAFVLKSDDQQRTESQHCAPVVDVRPIAAGDGGKGRFQSGSDHSSFQLASLDQDGVIIFWTALEMRSIDEAGSETDLGLGIGGRVKLTRTSRVQLNSINSGNKVETYAFGVFPNDNSHFIIGTANGSLIHKSRFASVVTPRVYECGMVENGNNYNQSFSSSCSAVVSIDFNPFVPNLFLVALDDGTLSMYKNDCGAPMTIWTGECIGLRMNDDDLSSMQYITNVKWSNTRPAVFFILDSSGMLHVWDLLQKQHGPISSQNPLKGEYDDSDVFIQHFDLTSCPVKGTKAKMFIGASNGDAMLYEISNRYSDPRNDGINAEIDELEAQINFF